MTIYTAIQFEIRGDSFRIIRGATDASEKPYDMLLFEGGIGNRWACGVYAADSDDHIISMIKHAVEILHVHIPSVLSVSGDLAEHYTRQLVDQIRTAMEIL